MVILLFVNCEILIIVDEYVDCEFGMGVVKIIFVYDFNDYEVGKCYSLLMVNVLILNVDICDEVEIIGIDGKLFVGYEVIIFVDFCGLECFVVCKKIVVDFEVFGLLDEIKLYDLKVFYGDCGGVLIELMLID